MSKIFNISIKQIIIILIISSPMGYYLYSQEVEKIIYEINVEGGTIISKNLCGDIREINGLIVTQPRANDHISKVISGIYAEYPNKEAAGKVGYDSGKNEYKIVFKAKYSDREILASEGRKIIRYILDLENKIYEKYYRNIKLNCAHGAYQAFSYIPLDTNSISYFTSRRHDKWHAYVLLISPLIIIYLLIIVIRRIKAVENNKNA
ncbi:hypothetical protein [Polynucleobacter sp. AP-Kolm-20A-A1]|uniref:hypothetical protein n=1 Tax=Polynucleobacter sp. AP-Kolm-20A-A1 TaxID=2081041 RepID=UPI001BFDA078|nr:hypothetical protein [Polynucleobacter sp. AP-Kolm-20A-A1]QWE20930.1 hypothetical protein C2745_01685 [Polynucleobacter sp. AP-Kolm-20A-A1]